MWGTPRTREQGEQRKQKKQRDGFGAKWGGPRGSLGAEHANKDARPRNMK